FRRDLLLHRARGGGGLLRQERRDAAGERKHDGERRRGEHHSQARLHRTPFGALSRGARAAPRCTTEMSMASRASAGATLPSMRRRAVAIASMVASVAAGVVASAAASNREWMLRLIGSSGDPNCWS